MTKERVVREEPTDVPADDPPLSAQRKPPPGVGPHEGRELALMLAGQKPLACFCDVVPASYEMPESDFAPHVMAGTIVRREDIYRRPEGAYPTRYVYYALPRETWRLDAIHAINEAIYTGRRQATEQDEIETGRLLGYSEDEIRIFLDWTRDARIKAGLAVG